MALTVGKMVEPSLGFSTARQISNVGLAESNHQIRHDGGISTPEWMIMIGDITASASTVTDYDGYVELLGYFSEASRETRGLTGGQMFTSAAMQHSNVVVKVPHGTFAAGLEVAMNNGTNIETITLVYLGNTGDAPTPLMQIEYASARIVSIQEQLTDLIVTFRFETKTKTHYTFDQTGASQGQAVSTTDFGANTTEAS